MLSLASILGIAKYDVDYTTDFEGKGIAITVAERKHPR
jgi:hypothetical protein